jgi:hypothetical protein
VSDDARHAQDERSDVHDDHAAAHHDAHASTAVRHDAHGGADGGHLDDQPLGPLDWERWRATILGAAVGLLVAGIFALTALR